MTTNTLQQLLDAHQHLPPEYTDGLSNHLPMAAHALHALGADAARLAAFAGRYAQRFTATPALSRDLLSRALPQARPPADWLALRGTPDGHVPLLAHFQQALAAQGRDAVLRAALPQLLPGLAAAAFHGLIRVAHGVQAGSGGELAAGLAYWAWRWQPLAPPVGGTPMPFGDWSREVVAQAPACVCEGGLFSVRMANATASPLYQTLAGRLAPEPGLLRHLSRFAAERYAATRNLLVLHMLTATRAWRVLQPWLPATDGPPPAPIDTLVHALTAAYLAARIPQGLRLAAPHPSTWDDVVAAAVRSGDDHVIKLVHACREEAAVDGDGVYLAAARRAVSAQLA